MHKGIVKYWKDDKGYGFIGREGQPDLFTHYTCIISDAERKTLIVGQHVSFDVEIGPKGKPQAINVTVEG